MTRRPFDIADLHRFEYVTEAQLSPDGSQVVYVVLRADATQDAEYSGLWLLDVNSGHTRQLTSGDWMDYAPAWSPDGAGIAYLSTRNEKKAQVCLLSIASGDSRALTARPQGCAGPLIWSPDGAKIAFTATRDAAPPDATQPRRVTRSVYRFDGIGDVDPAVKQICLLDVASGAITQLTQTSWNHTPAGFSPSGNELLCLAGFNPDSIFTSAAIHAISLQGASRPILSSDWGIIHSAVWLQDGRIAFAGVPAGKTYGTRNELFVMQDDGSGIERRTASLPNIIEGRLHDDIPVPWSYGPPRILPSADARDAILCTQNGGEVHLIRVALAGPESIETLARGERFCFPLSRAGQALLFGVSTPADPTQLCLLDLNSLAERPLTALNRDLLAQIQLPEMRRIRFNSADGVEVEGWIFVPEGAAPHPTILHIHGGPHAAYGHAFHFDVLSLTSVGYAVLFVNYRGSTGYGDAFATAINKDWGNLDQQDLMAGVDHVVQLGIADADRLGCCGVSAGGFHSCWIAATSTRFKAIVPENPVTNWVSFYGTADIGPVFAVRELGGKPHEVPDVYRRCSPITYAHQCTTPTLLIIGEDDHRCPPEQAEQFYTVLKASGCTVEMIRIPNSTHDGASSGSFAARRVQNEVLVDWMNRFVRTT